MGYRRVLLCLPERPSEEVLAVVRSIKAALATEFQVRISMSSAFDLNDDGITPIDNPLKQTIVLRITEGEERTT